MLRNGVILLGFISLGACANGLGPSALSGIYDGDYTTTAPPQISDQAELHIVEASDTVWGTLHVATGRSAYVHGPILGSFLALRIAFNDTCGGLATSTVATITDGGRHVAGRFNVSGGCDGRYSVSYSLTKQ